MPNYHKLYTAEDSAVVFIDHQPQMTFGVSTTEAVERLPPLECLVAMTLDLREVKHQRADKPEAEPEVDAGGTSRSENRCWLTGRRLALWGIVDARTIEGRTPGV